MDYYKASINGEYKIYGLDDSVDFEQIFKDWLNALQSLLNEEKGAIVTTGGVEKTVWKLNYRASESYVFTVTIKDLFGTAIGARHCATNIAQLLESIPHDHSGCISHTSVRFDRQSIATSNWSSRRSDGWADRADVPEWSEAA